MKLGTDLADGLARELGLDLAGSGGGGVPSDPIAAFMVAHAAALGHWVVSASSGFADGDPISSLPDMLDGNAVSALTTQRPTYDADAFSGGAQPAIRFTRASSQRLIQTSSPVAAAFNGAAETTVSYRLKLVDLVNTQFAVSVGQFGGNRVGYGARLVTGNMVERIALGGVVGDGTQVLGGSEAVVVCIKSATSLTTRVNGVVSVNALAAGTAGTTMSAIGFGCLGPQDSPGSFLDGWLNDICFFSEALDATEAAALEACYSAKY